MGTGFRDIARRLQRLFDRPLVPPPGAVSALAAEALAQSKVFREDRIFSAVGHALSMWARMEEGLVAIAAGLLKTRFDKAGIVMYSVINFYVWLNIIDDLFSTEPMFMTLKPRWNQIVEKLKPLKDIRDRLARHSIYYPEADGKEDRSLLRPGRLDTRTKSRKHQPLDLSQINDFYNSVTRVMNDISDLIDDFSDIVAKLETLQQKSSEPSSDQNPP